MIIKATIELTELQVREFIVGALARENITIDPTDICFKVEKKTHGDPRDSWETFEFSGLSIRNVPLGRTDTWNGIMPGRDC